MKQFIKVRKQLSSGLLNTIDNDGDKSSELLQPIITSDIVKSNLLNVKDRNVNVRCLVDTGSSINAISNKLFQKLKFIANHKQKQNVVIANCTEYNSLSYTYYPAKISNKTVNIGADVCED